MLKTYSLNGIKSGLNELFTSYQLIQDGGLYGAGQVTEK
jgi:hypothetical protein